MKEEGEVKCIRPYLQFYYHCCLVFFVFTYVCYSTHRPDHAKCLLSVWQMFTECDTDQTISVRSVYMQRNLFTEWILAWKKGCFFIWYCRVQSYWKLLIECAFSWELKCVFLHLCTIKKLLVRGACVAVRSQLFWFCFMICHVGLSSHNMRWRFILTGCATITVALILCKVMCSVCVCVCVVFLHYALFVLFFWSHISSQNTKELEALETKILSLLPTGYMSNTIRSITISLRVGSCFPY